MSTAPSRAWIGSAPGLLRRAPAALLEGALSAGQELTWLAAHAITYPVGLLAEQGEMEDPRYRTDTLSPLTRGLLLGDIAAAGTPVVLVHGIGDNRSAFAILRRTLRRRGYGRITTVNYSPLTSDVRKAAADLARHVERLCAQTGYEQLFLVGHSLGGLIARYYVQCLGGDARVNTLVTLGSPHAGTQLARIAPLPVARQLRPGSELMRELAGPADCGTRFVAIYSDRDEVVVPNRSARLDHPDLTVTRLRVHGVGHLALLVNSTVMHTVAGALSASVVRDATALHADIGACNP
ncbi:alpha/beta fold hydrolase [Jatrophihabitans lederbergiae]|uniref:Alpha/beta fold hydrolase n=1 Tax=Jatrophihabitans lederbergiae TaxID=3075547 RepID=A0ABU2J7K0_9ACTN|nr:alpha/beta fold hydrolase [Jatrophihabitans sp. DSM 44399]MDT0260243.1 alpha/beta fold hydrolase [Jatrophihabitans sp. DSM 44399]